MEDSTSWEKPGCGSFNSKAMAMASTSVASKRVFPFDLDDVATKKHRTCTNLDQTLPKAEIYTPIATLPHTTKMGPIIKGTLLSVTPWFTIPNNSFRCMNFRLKDESGEMPGIVYEPMSEGFKNTFTTDAEIIIGNPKIQQIDRSYRTTNEYQLVVTKWTLIKIKPAPTLPLKKEPSDIIQEEACSIAEPVAAKTTEPYLNSPQFEKPFPKLEKSTQSNEKSGPLIRVKDSRLLYENASENKDSNSVAEEIPAVRSSVAISNGNRTLIKTVIERIDDRDIVDVMGILTEVHDIRIVENREGSIMSRELRIIDESKQSIIVKLWRDKARDFDSPVGVVIAINKIAVRLYGDEKTLISNAATEIIIDPATLEAKILGKWYRQTEDKGLNRKEASTNLPTPVSRETSDNHEENSSSKSNLLSQSLSEDEVEFMSINCINETSEDEDIVGTIGFVVKQGHVKEKKLKNGKIQRTISILLSNGEGSEIRVNVHGDRVVDDESIPLRSIMLVRKAKVRDDFDLKILNCVWTYVEIDPDIPEAQRIRKLCWKNEKEVKAENKPVIEQASIETNSDKLEANQIQFASLSVPKNAINGDIPTIPKISSITETSSEVLPLSRVNYDFTPIKEIVEEKDIGSLIDVIGIAVSINKPMTTGKGKEEVVLLRDQNGHQIYLIIGRLEGEKHIEIYSVLCVKNGELNLFDDERVLCCLRSSITIDPDIPEARSFEKARTMGQTWHEILRDRDDHPRIESSNENIDESKVELKVEVKEEVEVKGESEVKEEVEVNEEFEMKEEVEVKEEVEAQEEIKVQQILENISPESPSNLSLTEPGDNFTFISDIIEDKTPGSKISKENPIEHVIGVVINVSPEECRKFGGNKTSVKKVTLMDDTNCEIDVTIWGSSSNDSIIALNSVLLVEDAIVRSKNEVKQLICFHNRVIVDPDSSHIHRVKNLSQKSTCLAEISVASEPMEIEQTPVISSKKVSIDNHSCPVNKSQQEGTMVEKSVNECPNEIPLVKNDSSSINKKQPMIVAEVKLVETSFNATAEKISDVGHSSSNNEKQSEITAQAKLLETSVNVSLNEDSVNDHTSPRVEKQSEITAGAKLVERSVNVSSNKVLPVNNHSFSMNEMQSKITAETKAVETGFNPSVNRAPIVNYRFRSIDEIQSTITEGHTTCFIGHIVHMKDPVPRATKMGKNVTEVTLRDEKCSEIVVAIWGTELAELNIRSDSVFLLKNAMVILYNSRKQLSCPCSAVSIDPDIPETYRLKSRAPIVQVNENVSKVPVNENSFNSAVSRIERTFNSNVSSSQISVMNKPWRSINEIKSIIAVNSAIDFIGIMVSDKNPQSRVTQYNQIVTEVVLTDDRCSEIVLAIWGPILETFNIRSNTVFAVKNATVVLFNYEKRLKCALSNVTIDPNIPETSRLRNLFSNVANVTQMAYNSFTTRAETPYNSNVSTITLPLVSSNYRSISEINSTIAVKTTIDFIGIVIAMSAPQSRVNKNGKEVTVTEVTLTDDRSSEIVAAIWGLGLDPAQIQLNTILAAKNVMVIEWNYKKRLNCLLSSIVIEPEIPEAYRLKQLLNVPQVTETSDNIVAVTDAVVTTCNSKSNLSLGGISPVNSCYRSVEEIELMISIGSTIDFIGFIIEIKEPIMRKTQRGNEITMTEVILTDDTLSNNRIVLVVWGPQIDKNKVRLESVLVVKGAKVISFNECKRLSCLRASVTIDPNIPEVCRLKGRYNKPLKRVNQPPACKSPQSNGHHLDPIVETRSEVTRRNIIESPPINDQKCHVPIQEIVEKYSPGMYIHVLGIVTQSSQFKNVRVRGQYSSKIEVELLDQSEQLITMTVWGPVAETLKTDEYPIIEGVNVIIRVYKDETQITCTENKSTLNVEPPGEETRKLREWFDTIGQDKLLKRKLRSQELSTNITFTPIDVIKRTMKAGEIINVFGIVQDLEAVKEITKKDYTTSSCREILIVDESRSSIRMTLFGENALVIKKFQSVVTAVKVMVRLQKNELDLVCTDRKSLLYVDPSIEKTQELRSWYKLNAIDNPFVESILPITPNDLVFKNLRRNEHTSIVGVLMKKYDVENIERSGKLIDISRKITMIDNNEKTITFIIFGDRARHFDFTEGSIMLVTHLYIFKKHQDEGCFCSNESNFIVNPTDPKVEDHVKKLKLWLTNSGAMKFQNLLDSTIAPITVGDVVNSTMIENNTMIRNTPADKNIVVKVKDEPISQEVMEVDDNRIYWSQPSLECNIRIKKIVQPKTAVENLQEYLGDERQPWDD